MQTFPRELIYTHCVGEEWPTFCGRVAPGESFVVDTIEGAANGPIEIVGVRAGDSIAIHIEAIEMQRPFMAAGGGPLFKGKRIELELRDGWFYWPKHFKLRAQPSVGSVAVLPAPTDEILQMSRWFEHNGLKMPNQRGWRRVVRDARDRHGHQDCGALGVGSVIHMRANVDGAGLCLEDVHGYIGQGEMAFAAIEMNARVQVRVERSSPWHVDWPVIETADEILVFSSYSSAYCHRPRMRYVDVVRQAYASMVDVVARRIGGTPEEANPIVAIAVDIRNCALYGLEGFVCGGRPQTDDIALAAALPKSVFTD